LLYREGIAGFQEATQEGYGRAASAFRKASVLKPARCDYALHLAESLVFLARERRLNWEDFGREVSEAEALIRAAQQRTDCASFSSFVYRLRALTEPDGPKLIERAIQLDAKDPRNWLVQWQLSSGKAANAVAQAVALGSELAAVQYESGNAHLDLGDFIAAKEAFERALALSPRHYLSLLGMAYASSSADSNADVLPIYERVVDVAPRFLAGRLFLGDQYSAIEETEKAVAQYQSILNTTSAYFPALVSLGTTLAYSDRSDEAESPLRAAIKVVEEGSEDRPAPTACSKECAGSQAHFLLGLVLMKRGDSENAEREFRESLRRAQNFDAMFGLGTLLNQKGRTDEAAVQYQNALRFEKYLKDPRRESQLGDLYLSLAGIRLGRDQLPEAVNALDRAIEIYSRQVERLSRDAAQSELRGFARKASLERDRKNEIERRLEQARQSRKRAGRN